MKNELTIDTSILTDKERGILANVVNKAKIEILENKYRNFALKISNYNEILENLIDCMEDNPIDLGKLSKNNVDIITKETLSAFLLNKEFESFRTEIKKLNNKKINSIDDLY